MNLTWKDLTTTILAILVVLFTYSKINGGSFPLISGYRSGIIALAIMGMLMCALGSAGPNMWQGPWMITLSILGFAMLGIIIIGLIIDTKTWFILTAGVIIMMWVLSTLRHLLT